MKTVLIYFNALCFLLIILLVWTIIGSDYVDFLPVELVYGEVCQNHRKVCEESPDSINIAVQLGRLDFISTSLAILGTAFGLVAIFGFMYIKENAAMVATSTAEETAKEYMTSNIDDITNEIFTKIDYENSRRQSSNFDLDSLDGFDADTMAASYEVDERYEQQS